MNMLSKSVGRRKSAPWLMAGLAFILVCAVAVFAVRNVQRAREHMLRSYLDHADALFWALEAGTRIGMGMHGGPGYFQSLVEETAKQHGIVYLAVTNSAGMILAHSDPAMVGRMLHADAPAEVEPERRGRFLNLPQGGQVYEVFKKFAPVPGMHHSMWCVPMNGGGMHMMGGSRNAATDEAAIFLGLDVRQLQMAVEDELQNSLVIGGLVVLLGLGGFAALFWAEHYRRSRRLLQDTRAFASEVVTCLPLGLLTTDPQDRVVLANAVAADFFGRAREDVAGRELKALGGMDWDGVLDELRRGAGVPERELELVFETGPSRPVSFSASRIVNEDGQFLGHLFLLRDLAEVRRLQAQVRRNERLSALGNMAAGVAHEIRNPLSSIKGFATYLAGKVQGKDREAARAMVQEADRLNRVVSELLEFARPGDVTLREEDLGEVVERTLRLVRADAAAREVGVDFARDEDLPRIPLDAERMTQALLNLFINAVQSMEPGGVLRISTAVDSRAQRVALRIEDTGHGMAQGVLKDIFNPYFTTKSTGTGLGLAIVHRIVEAHDAEITVESAPGRGTVFTILLPMAGRAR